MQITSTLRLDERELWAVYNALARETARVISEEGAESPKLDAIRSAREKIAARLQDAPQIAALAVA